MGSIARLGVGVVVQRYGCRRRMRFNDAVGDGGAGGLCGCGVSRVSNSSASCTNAFRARLERRIPPPLFHVFSYEKELISVTFLHLKFLHSK